MTDLTAGRSAGTPLNAEFDPMGRPDAENARRRAELDDLDSVDEQPAVPTAGPKAAGVRQP